MSKKQVLLISIIAAIPAAGLVAVLVLAGFQGYANQWSGALWGMNVIAGLLAAFVAVSPVLIGLLYPAAGFAAAAAGATTLGPGETFTPESNRDDEEEAPEDDGEQLFDDDAMEDSFDDEFEGSFGDDEEDSKR